MQGEKGEFRSGFATVVGRPNVGKSTLVNALTGHKVSIVSDKPQTTRNRIHGVYTSSGLQIIFVDTPGIHRPRNLLGDYMVEVARKSLTEVEVVLWVVDGSVLPAGGEQHIAGFLSGLSVPVILVINKEDLIPAEILPSRIEVYRGLYPFSHVQTVSALNGTGLKELMDAIGQFLPPGPQYYPADMVTDQPQAFVLAEIIREKAITLTRDEVPYGIAVGIEEITKRSEELIYVRATLYTERESQKGIIIGHKGQMLKAIGQLARQDMEAWLGVRVYLDLRVKTKKEWRQDQVALRQLGYDRKGL